jgi:acetyl-CoA C-acetyltransferase
LVQDAAKGKPQSTLVSTQLLPYTIKCASGMKAVMMGAKQFKLRCRNCYRWRNGNMSLIFRIRYEKRNHLDLYYGRWITKDGLVDAYDNNAMEFVRILLQNMNLVEKIKITMLSVRTFSKSMETGKFDQEVVPVAVPQKR